MVDDTVGQFNGIPERAPLDIRVGGCVCTAHKK